MEDTTKAFTKIERQEVEISYIKKTLDELVEQNKRQSEQLASITKSIQKQEVILEKITYLEDKYHDGIKRVHKRIDEEVKKINEILTIYKDEFGKIKEDMKKMSCPIEKTFLKDIEYLKKQQDRHAKIFWWVGSLIIGAVILAILKSHFK